MSNLILEIERPGFGGLFIARHNGKIVMVKGAVLPGETVEVVVEDDKRDYMSASAVKITAPSPLRVEPPCEYFGRCGGCQFQHAPYDLQVKLKEHILADCLKRLAKIELNLSNPIVNENPWNYRIRGQFKVSEQGVGFHRSGTREVINIDRCLIMKKEINEFIPEADRLVREFDIKELHLTSGDSIFARVVPNRGTRKSSAYVDRLASEFLRAGLPGLVITRGNKKILRCGKSYTTLRLGQMEYTVSPDSFLQSSWDLNQSVTEFIKTNLQPLKNKRILDLYAGAGNFSLPLAGEAEVTAVEESSIAVEDGRRNSEINHMEQCRFIRSSAEEFRSRDRFDILILDPPRQGLSKKVMRNVMKLMPERIAYISCNPATFARDIKGLQARYHIESIRMIDFFPQTFHIEALAILNMK